MSDGAGALVRRLFSLALLGGIAVGWLAARDLRAGVLAAPTPLPTTLPHQTNVLLVGVTALDDRQATLLSAWLVTLQNDQPELDFFPVYPVHPAMNLNDYAGRHDPITVQGDDLDAIAGLEVIAAQGLHWDLLVVLDEAGLTTVLGAAQGGGALTANEASLFASRPANAWDNPELVRAHQENLIRYLCQQNTALAGEPARSAILALLGEHAAASMDRSALAAFAEMLSERESELACRFPLSGE
ncbi:MAG: hypothetical protein EPO32_02265 [Anaerolineae bacterium]|nr:MAG: hypothetical protein EPO32_02265 [Anaerolineae bacterium]